MLEIVFEIFLSCLMFAGSFCTLLGLLTVAYWIKTPPKENDDSNRINNIKSWWIGLTRPEVLGVSYKAFKDDVLKQLQDSNKD